MEVGFYVYTHLHLLGADIVCTNNETFGVFLKKGLDLDKIIGLPFFLSLPNHLDAAKDKF